MSVKDLEQQQQGDDYSDDMELVGYPQHQITNTRTRNKRSSRRRRRGGANGNYQQVTAGTGSHHSLSGYPNSSFDDDDDDDEDDNGDDDNEGYNSGEDEGLISRLGDGDHINDAGSAGNGLDDYFMYGFSSSHSAAGGERIDWRCAFWLGISFLLAACLAIVLPRYNNFGRPLVRDDGTLLFPNGTIENISGITDKTSHKVNYQCPSVVPDAQNYANTSIEASYNNQTSEIENNFTGFLDNFHNAEFDGWGKTYDFVKAGMYHWKSTRFPKHLQDGNTIYESACGIGLNLIMTLEILQEVKGVNNLIVYGNEYLAHSVNTSNLVLDALLPSLNATKGSVCTGDSTDLHFIPSDSFDLVFTGYISTLLDPLDLGMGVTKNFEQYELLCDGKTWQDQKLAEVVQQRQRDWFGLWTSEMIRIAKPGAPVIIEQVSYPFCKAKFDWGGVNQKFWTDYAIEQYGWDVDRNSMEFEDDRLFRKRYHVFMRKNGGGYNATKEAQPLAAAQHVVTVPPEEDKDGNSDGGGGR